MTTEERMALILTPEFLNANADLDSVDLLYEAVAKIDPEIEKDDFVEILKKSAAYADSLDELGENDLEKVAGGGPLTALTVAGAIVAIGGALAICYKSGKALGQALYYLTH